MNDLVIVTELISDINKIKLHLIFLCLFYCNKDISLKRIKKIFLKLTLFDIRIVV